MPGTPRSRALARAAILTVTAIIGGGCAPSSPPPAIPVKQAQGLLVQVVDSLNDAGRGSSVAIGADGVPAVSYLLLKPVLKKNEIPPPVVAGQAQPPSVMLAAQAEGLWSLTSVTAQAAPGEEAVGSATEIANQDGQAVPGVTTSLAIDPQGARHVVWSTPKGLFYATDAGGTFGEPDQIISAPAFGAAIAVGEGGSLFVSFHTSTTLRVAERSGNRWSLGASLRNTGPTTPATVTAIAVGPDGPIVAFGDDGKSMVARRSAPPAGTTTPAGWALETVGDGGYGMSMDLDKDGNPHLAYYDGRGNVRHAHSIGGGPWEVTDIDSVGAPTKGDSDAGWSTGIALDDEGVHYVTWADTTEKRIEFATNAEGGFEPQPVNSGQGGANPAIAVSGDGETIVVAWFDSVNANLKVAQTPSGELVLAHPTERPAAPTGPAPQPTAQCEPDGTELAIAAPSGAATTGFDKDCLAAPAGEAFTIAFDNQDANLHNVAIYTDNSGSQSLFVGDILQGPAQTTYNVDPLDAGNFFFRCDVHPTTMTGSFVVPEG